MVEIKQLFLRVYGVLLLPYIAFGLFSIYGFHFT